MSTETKSLHDQLIDVKEEHRRRHLSDELNEISETMEETILQRHLAKGFFKEEVAIDNEARTRVQEVLDLLQNEEYEAVESELKDLENTVETAATTVENRIQELRLKHNSTVAAMRRLNKKVERVNETRLEALEELLGDWRWKVHVYDDESDLSTLKQNANQYGKEMREAFEEMKEELFGAYPEEIRNLVFRMIEDERLSYDDLSQNQRQELADSDVSEYIELTLS